MAQSEEVETRWFFVLWKSKDVGMFLANGGRIGKDACERGQRELGSGRQEGGFPRVGREGARLALGWRRDRRERREGGITFSPASKLCKENLANTHCLNNSAEKEGESKYKCRQ